MVADEVESPELSTALGFDDVSNVLLVVSPHQRHDLSCCLDLLTLSDPGEENIWSLGFTLSPNKRVENWDRHVEEKPGAFQIVTVGSLPQTTAEETARKYGFDPEPTFVTVPDGSDLTRIGVELTVALSEWQRSDRQTVICFHSVSALLQYTDEKRAYQFLNTFSAHVEEEGAVAHYHMSPGAHDDATIAKMASIFDAVVEIDTDGDCQISAR